MKAIGRPAWLNPDLTLGPWVLLLMLWFSSLCQQSGFFLALIEDYGVNYFFSPDGNRYLVDLKHAILPYSILGFIGVLVLFPKWSWLLCGALSLGSLVQLVQYRDLLAYRAFWVPAVVPVLVNTLAVIVALHRRKKLEHGA